MKQAMPLQALFFLLAVLFFASCKKESGSGPPVANAGADIFLNYPADSMVLDGSASHSRDGNTIQYRWRKIDGPPYPDLTDSSSPRTVIRPPRPIQRVTAGVYRFELTVTDNKGQAAKDTVQATVSLQGQEFVFDDLIWETWENDYGGKQIGISTPALPEIFYSGSYYDLNPGPGSTLEVYIKPENTSSWVRVRTFPVATGEVYVYYLVEPWLAIVNYPPDLQLEGKKASIKLKFL